MRTWLLLCALVAVLAGQLTGQVRAWVGAHLIPIDGEEIEGLGGGGTGGGGSPGGDLAS